MTLKVFTKIQVFLLNKFPVFFYADPFDYFLLDDESGELRTAKPLNREALKDSTGVLTLEVRARELIDGMPGNDNLTVSTAEATVTIKDVNDEPPTFNRREYNIEIPENVPNGTSLPHLDMTVKDPDVVSIITLEHHELFKYSHYRSTSGIRK